MMPVTGTPRWFASTVETRGRSALGNRDEFMPLMPAPAGGAAPHRRAERNEYWPA